MPLDNTKTITSVTYNGNDWPVGGGGGGYTPGIVSFASGQTYEIGQSVPSGICTFEELLSAIGLSPAQLQGCTLKLVVDIPIYIRCPIANYQNGELDGLTFEALTFLKDPATPLLSNVVGQVRFNRCGITSLMTGTITDNGCSGLVQYISCSEEYF